MQSQKTWQEQRARWTKLWFLVLVFNIFLYTDFADSFEFSSDNYQLEQITCSSIGGIQSHRPSSVFSQLFFFVPGILNSPLTLKALLPRLHDIIDDGDYKKSRKMMAQIFSIQNWAYHSSGLSPPHLS